MNEIPESRERHLKVTEIFHSLQGEALQIGLPTVFVRLTGCPLRCTYCDSEYAFYGGEWMHYDEILAEIRKYHTKYVCVTGGEPLAQKRCKKFLKILCDAGFTVSLETSGAMDIARADRRVSRVMDLKTPASREQSSNRWENLSELTGNDQIKFVICSRADYEWAKHVVEEHHHHVGRTRRRRRRIRPVGFGHAARSCGVRSLEASRASRRTRWPRRHPRHSGSRGS